MNAGQLAVCVAMNDNDRAWYEMLIPFVLSLRQSDYNGHIAVIGYGLAQRKIEILQQHSINVVMATEHPLPFGRFVEVAKLCEMNPELTRVALYDADIWFCSRTFDLFSYVEGDSLFVCGDAFLCDFISDPLIGPGRDANLRRVNDEVVRRYGGALQAGLVAGTAAAWRDFAAHVRTCIEGIGTDFLSTYGTDTTFLHLWGAEGRVALLPETQNFVTKNGVIERRDDQTRPLYLSASGPIRGLHMTTDIRFLNSWRYYSNHADYALEQGLPYALSTADVAPLSTVSASFAAEVEAMGFELIAMAGEEGANQFAFRDRDGLAIIGAGNHDITLRTTRAFEQLVLTVMYVSGHPAPIKVRIALGGSEMTIGKDLSQWTSARMPAGTEIRLHSDSLPGQMCKIVWTIADRYALSQ